MKNSMGHRGHREHREFVNNRGLRGKNIKIVNRKLVLSEVERIVNKKRAFSLVSPVFKLFSKIFTFFQFYYQHFGIVNRCIK